LKINKYSERVRRNTAKDLLRGELAVSIRLYKYGYAQVKLKKIG
jgi:hypothetical protein